jgi:hypothetical protein
VRRTAAARHASVAVLVCTLTLASTGWLAPWAHAAGDASAAAGFIESAQRPDGGFPPARGGASRPEASLWAVVALLAAGKNPADELVNNGTSAAGYLAAHLRSLRSLADLGLLAIVQAGSGSPPGRFGDPATQLKADLTAASIGSDPGGAALGIIGLTALHSDRAAGSAARLLLAAQLPDHGWGRAGSSDSASTALVLEALAQTGLATDAGSSVRDGVRYLHSAQVNDGSIAVSDRTDASSSGDVAATAFTIQALEALHHLTLRTSTGTSVLEGLASYQQRSTGGLSPFGAYDTGVAPSVVQTAEAYPAFDGIPFPLPYVPPLQLAPRHTSKLGPSRASTGTGASGISNTSATPTRTVSAYRGATARGSARSRATRALPQSGEAVTGEVVGAAAPQKLSASRGRAPAKDLTALYLVLLLAAVAGLGVLLDLRPASSLRRSWVAAAVQATADLAAAARRRRALAPALAALVGATLCLAPSASSLWSRAPQGATMLQAFRPYMSPTRLSELRADVNVLDAGFREAGRYRGTSRLAAGWAPIDRRFTGLLDQIASTRGDYEAISAVPTLRVFPWLLVAPGAILIALGGAGLAWPGAWRRLRMPLGALGAALVIAPLGVGLFGAGAGGARLVSSFRTIESRRSVVALQNDFSMLVVVQAELRSSLPARVAVRMPAVAALDARWIRTLGDFTPMLGVMSDQVPRYQAVAALPDFRLFPWLFAGPGLLALALALLGSLPRSPAIGDRLPGRRRLLEIRSRA